MPSSMRPDWVTLGRAGGAGIGTAVFGVAVGALGIVPFTAWGIAGMAAATTAGVYYYVRKRRAEQDQ